MNLERLTKDNLIELINLAGGGADEEMSKADLIEELDSSLDSLGLSADGFKNFDELSTAVDKAVNGGEEAEAIDEDEDGYSDDSEDDEAEDEDEADAEYAISSSAEASLQTVSSRTPKAAPKSDDPRVQAEWNQIFLKATSADRSRYAFKDRHGRMWDVVKEGKEWVTSLENSDVVFRSVKRKDTIWAMAENIADHAPEVVGEPAV